MLIRHRVLLVFVLAGCALAQTGVGRSAFDHAAAGGPVVLRRYF